MLESVRIIWEWIGISCVHLLSLFLHIAHKPQATSHQTTPISQPSSGRSSYPLERRKDSLPTTCVRICSPIRPLDLVLQPLLCASSVAATLGLAVSNRAFPSILCADQPLFSQARAFQCQTTNHALAGQSAQPRPQDRDSSCWFYQTCLSLAAEQVSVN